MSHKLKPLILGFSYFFLKPADVSQALLLPGNMKSRSRNQPFWTREAKAIVMSSCGRQATGPEREGKNGEEGQGMEVAPGLVMLQRKVWEEEIEQSVSKVHVWRPMGTS